MADIIKINNGAEDYDICDANAVHKTENETIAGIKTFSLSPIVPSVASTDDATQKSASTGWVTDKLTAWWTTVKDAAVTFGSTLTVNGKITAKGGIAIDEGVAKGDGFADAGMPSSSSSDVSSGTWITASSAGWIYVGGVAPSVGLRVRVRTSSRAGEITHEICDVSIINNQTLHVLVPTAKGWTYFVDASTDVQDVSAKFYVANAKT